MSSDTVAAAVTANVSDKVRKKVILKVADGAEFEVDEAVATEFKTVKNLLKDESDQVVPLPDVKGTVLAKAVEFATKHVDLRAASASDEDVKSYNAGFLRNENDGSLRELVLAAEYLGNKELLDLANQHVAGATESLSNLTIEEFLSIDYQTKMFTPELMARVVEFEF